MGHENHLASRDPSARLTPYFKRAIAHLSRPEPGKARGSSHSECRMLKILQSIRNGLWSITSLWQHHYLRIVLNSNGLN